MGLYGGYGQAAWGRHQYGASASDIEPRFFSSIPADHSQNNPDTKVIEFQVYYYSSFPDLYAVNADTAIRVQLSFDGGLTFFTAESPDYTVTIRALDGQRYWIRIAKATHWPRGVNVKVRYRGSDEYGNPATKNMPVVWEE